MALPCHKACVYTLFAWPRICFHVVASLRHQSLLRPALKKQRTTVSHIQHRLLAFVSSTSTINGGSAAASGTPHQADMSPSPRICLISEPCCYRSEL